MNKALYTEFMIYHKGCIVTKHNHNIIADRKIVIVGRRNSIHMQHSNCIICLQQLQM
jgi:hypothetical protein